MFYKGSTARKILDNATEIVSQSLPFENVVAYYKSASGTGRDAVLKAVQFTSSTIVVCVFILLYKTTNLLT